MVGSGSALLIRIQLNNSDAHGPGSTLVGTGTELINTGNYLKKNPIFRQFCTGEYRKDGVPLGFKGNRVSIFCSKTILVANFSVLNLFAR